MRTRLVFSWIRKDSQAPAYSDALGYVSIGDGLEFSEDGLTWHLKQWSPVVNPARLAASGRTLLAYAGRGDSPALWAWFSG